MREKEEAVCFINKSTGFAFSLYFHSGPRFYFLGSLNSKFKTWFIIIITRRGREYPLIYDVWKNRNKYMQHPVPTYIIMVHVFIFNLLGSSLLGKSCKSNATQQQCSLSPYWVYFHKPIKLP